MSRHSILVAFIIALTAAAAGAQDLFVPSQVQVDGFCTTWHEGGSAEVFTVSGHLADLAQLLAHYGVTGGALIDIEGNLIGIVGFVNTGSKGRPNTLGQSSGVGFANTSTKLLSILDDLKDGKVLSLPKRAFLGIKMEPSYNKNDGVLVKEVTENTAAAEAGIEPGDLIVEMDGKPVRNITELINIMKKKKIGDKVKIKLKRGDEIIEIEATLREPPPGM